MAVPSNGGSTSFAVNQADLLKLGKGLLIACAGAALTYGSSWIADTSFGLWTPIVAAGWAVVVNFVRKFVVDNNPTPTA
jgi:hypothetical protein